VKDSNHDTAVPNREAGVWRPRDILARSGERFGIRV